MRFDKTKIISNKLIGLNFHKIIFGPVFNSYSSDFASFLRNIFFTSIKGYGITEVKFFGADNEFDYISGVQEDVFNLILNLKGVIFSIKNKKKIILNLNKKGPCIVKASDFYLNEFTKILNPDHIIAHLSENFYLNITLKIEKGLGYFFLNNDNYKKNKDLDGILLDVNFCPILNVYYKIVNINKNKNFNNIEFYIKTNGAISGKKVILKSIKILKNIINLKIKKKNNNNFFIKISKLNLSNIFLSYLKKMKVKYLGELIFFKEKDILKASNLDFDFLNKIKNILSVYNFYLNIKGKKLGYYLKNNETFKKKK